MANPPTALIIGASRGLGLGLVREYLAREWHVIGTVRSSGGSALHALAEAHASYLEIEQLDISEPAAIAALRQRLSGRSLDVLFVNAGVANDPAEHVGSVSTETFVHVMTTNALGPMRVIETLEDLVAPDGTIAAMSSGLGSVARNETGGWEVYRASKAALNTLMRSFAARNPARSRRILVIAPGWVRTDMGGPQASLDVQTSIRGVVDTLAGHREPGIAFLDYTGKAVPW